jgi:hypothetical protein
MREREKKKCIHIIINVLASLDAIYRNKQQSVLLYEQLLVACIMKFSSLKCRSSPHTVCVCI